MKKIWLMRFTNEFQIKIIQRMVDLKFDVDVITINDIVEKKVENLNFLGKSLKINNNRICALDYDNPAIGNHRKKELKYHQNLYALQLLERFERFEGEISQDEKLYLLKKQTEYWGSLISERKPDIIIFCDLPHMYYEYIIIGVAKQHNIKSLILLNFAFSSLCLIDEDHKFIKMREGVSFYDAHRKLIENVKKHIHRDIDKIQYDHVTLVDVGKLLVKTILTVFKDKEYKNSLFIKRGYFNFGLNKEKDENFANFKYSVKAVLFKGYYDYISKNYMKPEKYIYFPLISNFENTLHPNISPDSLQSKILDIAEKYQKEYILVKEHPAQFRMRWHQRFSRTLKFYNFLKSIKNVILVPWNADSFDLITGAEIVVCTKLSSTYFEALANNKMIELFGMDLPEDDDDGYFLKDTNLFFGTEKDVMKISEVLAEQIDLS